MNQLVFIGHDDVGPFIHHMFALTLFKFTWPIGLMQCAWNVGMGSDPRRRSIRWMLGM